MNTCPTCNQPLPAHKHESDGDWTEPFTDRNGRTFQTSQCKDAHCKRLMTRELKKESKAARVVAATEGV